MNKTPRANRLHIALFGRRNAGKSSLINALTQQDIALVSEVLGTTTDPVFKTMEILPLGPVVLIDTAGLDDVGSLGEKRVKKTYDVLNKTDIALVVVDASVGITDFDLEVINKIKDKKLPFIVVFNKIDTLVEPLVCSLDFDYVKVSSVNQEGITTLKEKISKVIPQDKHQFRIVSDLIEENDVVILVTPIDSAAPKGRIILPQQQVARDILDHGGIVMVCREFELERTLASLKEPPSLVVTDSQAFEYVKTRVPKEVRLTSFSILFARYKGDLDELVGGAASIRKLKEGARILISEGCTHHRQKDDIGTVKIPRWLKEHTGFDFDLQFSSGYGYPDDLDTYDLIIHCGSCMLNRKEVLHRIEKAREQGVPIVNYGVFIAYVKGVFDRALDMFPDIKNKYFKE